MRYIVLFVIDYACIWLTCKMLQVRYHFILNSNYPIFILLLITSVLWNFLRWKIIIRSSHSKTNCYLYHDLILSILIWTFLLKYTCDIHYFHNASASHRPITLLIATFYLFKSWSSKINDLFDLNFDVR